MKKPATILLRILLKGYPIKKNGVVYFLSEDNYLCQEATNVNKNKKVLLKIGMGGFSLKEFIDWTNTFTMEEIAINTANLMLNDLNPGDLTNAY